MNQPLVSILMTAYNRENFIGEAIQSVLASSYSNFELIIVDDGSHDRTVEIARRYAGDDSRIQVHCNETNLGDYLNRNKAASYAKGKYLKYLDSDDLIYPHGLEIFVRHMEAHPAAALGLSSVVVQMNEPFPIQYNPEVTLRYHFFDSGILEGGPSGTIIRRDFFYEAGQFSGKRMIGDFELWLKLAITYPVLIVPPALIYWREHSGQEFKAGNSDSIYLRNSLPMLVEVLKTAEQVLTRGEREMIVNHHKRLITKQLLSLMIRNRKFSVAFEIYRHLQLTITDLFKAFFIKSVLKKSNV
jgi:glycosyltransferase involved in cell wall biosynthesis